MRFALVCLAMLWTSPAMAACDPGESRVLLAVADPKSSDAAGRVARGISGAVNRALQGRSCIDLVAGEPLATMSAGGAQLAIAPLAEATAQLPRWGALLVPFAFRDRPALDAFLKDMQPALMQAQGELLPLAFLSGPFSQLATRNIIVMPGELRGVRIAGGADGADRTMLSAVGATPQDVPEVDAALKDEQVEGTTAGWRALPELARVRRSDGPAISHVLETNHLASGNLVVASKAWRDGLAPELASEMDAAIASAVASTGSYGLRLDRAARRAALRSRLAIRAPTRSQRLAWLTAVAPVRQAAEGDTGVVGLAAALEALEQRP